MPLSLSQPPSGIGLESSILFAQEGANVLLVDVNLDNATKAAKLINERSPNIKAIPFKADVSKEAEVEAAVKLAVKEFGRLDVMVGSIFRPILSSRGAQSRIPSSEMGAHPVKAMTDWRCISSTTQELCTQKTITP